MPQNIGGLVLAASIMFAVLAGIAALNNYYSLNIKAKTVGRGQHGTARWATRGEIARTYTHVNFTPALWREGKNPPDKQGIVVGCKNRKHTTTALVDTGDVHAIMIAFILLIVFHPKYQPETERRLRTTNRGFQEEMTVTIHSIFNSILWGGLMALSLSALSRSRWFLCRFGVTPLVVLTAAALARCCLPVELQVTKEVGAATLNRLHKLIDRAAGSPTPETWFFEIWLTGTVLGLVLWLPKYTVRLWAARNLPVTDDNRIQRFCRKYGISGLRVAFTPRVFTPCVIGFWRETILLPDISYTHKQLDYILRHEYAHVKHHDGLLDFALCFICILFWWNPGVLICRAVAVRLCDHRCDTETLQSASPSAKRYYCRTLLEFASRYPSPTRQFASASLKSRFYLILYREAGAGTVRHLVTAIVALALLGMSYLILLQPAYQPESADYRQYAIHEGIIEQQEDGSYIFRTESGNFFVSASEIAAIQQEETSAIYKEGGALS